ncbi:MAG: tetratricopeptide repeat protein [Bdellovibrionales bacterium]|nr:tetratricopeptide repeat protein [Bdellovibrionales bacterium]
MLRICLSILLVSFSFSTLAQTAGEEDFFQKGLAAYQNRQYDEARAQFEKLIADGQGTPRVLHNLALTYYQLNQKPHALALWRKALAQDPGYSAARTGRELLENRFHMRPFERSSAAAQLRHTLEYLSFYEVLWLFAATLSLAGWLWLRYYAGRRNALEEEQPLPPFPTGAVLASILLIAGLALTFLRAGLEFDTRATVVTEKADARSLPAEDGVSLFELAGGNEVLVRRQNDGWTQVQNSEGATGWVKDSEILVTSGR